MHLPSIEPGYSKGLSYEGISALIQQPLLSRLFMINPTSLQAIC